MATYTSAATGLWSAGATWVGGVKPPSGAGHKIVIAAGHTVTYDEAAGEYGDDTSSSTAANNAIVVNGTLKFSRSVSTSLTCRGTLCYPGTLDIGSTSDPIPSGVTATLVLNYSTSLAAGKHGVFSIAGTSGLKVRGVVRTRNTYLTSAVSASGSSFSVDAAANWEVGDILAIESDTNSTSRSELVTITGGSGLTWTVSPAVTYARAAGTRVGNLSSNVTIKSSASSFPGAMNFYPLNTNTVAVLDFGDVRLENVGSTAAWAGVASANPLYAGGLSLNGPSLPVANVSVSRVAIAVTSTAQIYGLTCVLASLNKFAVTDLAIHMTGNTSHAAIVLSSDCRTDVDAVVYAAPVAIQGINNGSGGSRFTGRIRAERQVVSANPIGRLTLADCKLTTNTHPVFSGGSGRLQADNCDIDSTSGQLVSILNIGHAPEIVINRPTIGSGVLTSSLAVSGNVPALSQYAALIAVNGADSDNRVRSYWQETVTDLTTRKRATYAVKIQPKVANTAIVYTFTLPAVSGVAQVIKGSLRFDATYGTATPPSIALSGQGVTASFTAPATADAWHGFTLSFTPTSTGDITATVTVQSTSTSGFAWLDGIYHYPMTQSVRHYGYQWLPQAAQIVDTRLTLTEAAALALPIVVDHGAETITITGSATAREVFEACIADLCQTANQGEGVHISSSTGDTFATTYTVVGTVVGPYTDSAGLHVTVTAAAIVAGSRVQLYNVTDATELLNTTLGSTGLNYATTWTTDKTIRLRADHPDYLPLTAVGVLTSSGLTFLATQAEDTVYSANGIDGSTVTEFAADGANLQIDVSDPDGVTSVQRLYAWLQHYQTTNAGVASPFFGAMTAADSANYRVDAGLIDLKLDNVTGAPVVFVGGYLYRSDGSTVIAATSGSIQMDPGRAYVAPGGAAITVPEGERVILLQASGAHIARG